MFAAVYPASKIETDFNLEGFFPVDAPTIVEYQMLSDEFGRDDNLIGFAFKVDHVFDDQVLRDLRQITTKLAEIPNISDVFSIWDVNRFENVDDQLISSPYLDDTIYSSNDRTEILEDLLRNPFTSGVLINHDATVTAVYIELDDANNSYLVRSQVIRDMKEVLSDYDGTYDFRIAGIPYFRNQYVDMLNTEIVMYISVSSILIMILLWGLFRNVRGVLIPISIVWLTILLTVAVIVLTGGYFEIMSSTIAPILLCVGVADSIHMLAKYQDNRIQGNSAGTALRDTLIVLGGATLLTSITTAIGFGTLATSNVIPMKRFGLYTAAGVMIAFIVTIFVLPSILPFFKEKTDSNSVQHKIHFWLGEKLRKIFLWTNLHYKIIVISTILITVFFAFGTRHLKVNGKVFDDVGEDTQVMQDSRFFNEELIPQFPLEFVIDTGTPGGALSPELLEEIVEFEEYLTTWPEIHRTVSLTTLIKELHRTMSPELYEHREIPDDEALIAQYMILLEITDPDAAGPVVDFDYQKIRLASNIEDVGSYRINQIRAEINERLRQTFTGYDVYVSGTTVLVADLTDNIVGSLRSSILLAFIFIALLMAWLFRDLKLIIISLLPNVIPLIITAGVMGFAGVDIKPSTAVIFTIAFGIAVDDSIHYLARLRIEIGRTRSLREAIMITTEKTGRAIVLTSIILATGFGTLATSAFTSTMLMGALTCLTITTALIADILFLPALLVWMKPEFKSVQDE